MSKSSFSLAPCFPAMIFLSFLITIAVFSKDARSDQIDTLDLYLQWAYPIKITAMDLVDFDQDGINEILVGFNTDSAHVGILDAATQSVLWGSPGILDHIGAVTAGDRNDDGSLDIICGGWSSDPPVGYVQIFDGPDLNTADNVLGLDHSVTAIKLHPPAEGSSCELVVGTYKYDEGGQFSGTTKGHIYTFSSQELEPHDTSSSGKVKLIESCDVNLDGFSDIVYGHRLSWQYDLGMTFIGGTSIEVTSCVAESTWVLTVFYDSGLDCYPYGKLNAMTVGACKKDGSLDILVAYSAVYTIPWIKFWRLASFDALTGEEEWTIELDSMVAIGLALCNFINHQGSSVCLAYPDGLIEIKSGADGGDLAVSRQLPLINYFALGNVDHDDMIELCIASDESLYVYETPSITTDVEEVERPSRPEDFHLCQNYPNPFNPETTILFTIPVRAEVYLEIFNILGERVRKFERNYMPGTYLIKWDGKNSSGEDLSSGIYLYRLTAGDIKETRKMVLLR